MTPQEAGYIAGAFDARGSVSIFRQHAHNETSGYRGSIQIDTRAESQVLERFFGPPKSVSGYANPIVRYRTSRPEGGLVIVRGILSTVPEAGRLNELLVMQHFWLAEDVATQEKVATKMRTLKATGSVFGVPGG